MLRVWTCTCLRWPWRWLTCANSANSRSAVWKHSFLGEAFVASVPETLTWSDMSVSKHKHTISTYQRHHSTGDRQSGRSCSITSSPHECILAYYAVHCCTSSVHLRDRSSKMSQVSSSFCTRLTHSLPWRLRDIPWRLESLPGGIGFACGASCGFLHACCLSFLRAESQGNLMEHINRYHLDLEGMLRECGSAIWYQKQKQGEGDKEKQQSCHHVSHHSHHQTEWMGFCSKTTFKERYLCSGWMKPRHIDFCRSFLEILEEVWTSSNRD